MEELNRALDINTAVSGEYTQLGRIAFQSLLGLMVDYYCAVNQEDSVGLLEELLAVNKDVNADLGKMVV